MMWPFIEIETDAMDTVLGNAYYLTFSSTQVVEERGYAGNPHHRHACSAGHLTRSPPRRGQHDVVKGRARFVIALCPDNCGCLTWSY